MANCYSDMTGVLVLDVATPVIKALFGSFALDENHPGNGEAYIAEISESNSGSWDDIAEALLELFPDECGSDEEDDEIAIALAGLGKHFDVETQMDEFISAIDFEADPQVSDLFEIAQLCDDGHGLKAIKTETGWHCDRPRLFEFGGCGEYTSKSVNLHSSSSSAIRLGEALEDGLRASDFARCATALYEALRLESIKDSSARDAIAEALVRLVKEKHLEAQPALRYWAITGRIPGKDEDTCHVLRAATREEAIEAFKETMLDGWTEEDRDSVFRSHGQCVFINSVCVSDAPIEEA